MRFVFVEPNLGSPYGSIRRIVELSNALVDLGHDVDVYTPNGQLPGWIELRASVWSFLSLEYVHMRATHSPMVDCVVFNKAVALHKWLVDMVATRFGAVRAFYVLGWGETRLQEIQEEIRAAQKDSPLGVVREVFDDSRYVILSCSTWMTKHLRDAYRPDTRTLLGGLNRNHFHSDRRARPDEGPPWIVLSSGDPRPRKGIDTVKAAVGYLRKRGWEIEEKCYWGRHLPQSEMASFYSSGHVFADGQHWAGWNNPVVEAMACGTPVICTNIGGVADFAKDSETALLVRPRDLYEMAYGLVLLLRGKGMRAELAKNALLGVRQFRWERTARELQDMVLEKRKAR